MTARNGSLVRLQFPPFVVNFYKIFFSLRKRIYVSLSICPTAELWIRIRQLVCKDNCPQKVISHKPRRTKTFFICLIIFPKVYQSCSCKNHVYLFTKKTYCTVHMYKKSFNIYGSRPLLWIWTPTDPTITSNWNNEIFT